MIRSVTIEEINHWRNNKIAFQLIDVREEEEHQQKNIGGDLIPLREVMRNIDRVDISKKVVIYCKRGIRSQIAIQKLQRKLPNVDFYNLAGGIYEILEK
jgi:adenylyltransferase/sulfurtransferase